MAEDWPDIRHTYDVVAEDYADRFADELAGKPMDRKLLDTFAEEVAGPILDVGCGPAGHVARYLADRGADVAGVDLSPISVEAARTRNPDLRFDTADMRALPHADASFAGIIAFYSVVHLRRPDIPAALAEFHRVLRPGGRLLMSMHGGQDEIGADDWFDRGVSVRVTLVTLPELASLLEAAGFTITAQHERHPEPTEHPTPRLYVLARR